MLRRIQFRLRTIFVVTTIAAVFVAVAVPVTRYVVRKRGEARQHVPTKREMVLFESMNIARAVENMGAFATPCDRLNPDACVDVSFKNKTVSDDLLDQLGRLPRIGSLILDGTKVSDTGLAKLKGLTELTYLSLDQTNITDAGLKIISGMTKLRTLHLYETQITDAGLEELKGLTHLEELAVDGTKVTDQGVKKLQQVLPKCDILH